MSRHRRLCMVTFLAVLLFLRAPGGQATEPSLSSYTSYPVFQLNFVEPNILIILDNSDSMNLQAYSGTYDQNTTYYGYFEPNKKYTYGSNIFLRDPNGPWDGNFLNWLTMRRIDVARKVLMGGLATSRQGTGNQTNIGEASASGYDFTKDYQDVHNVTPFFNGGLKSYLVDGGSFSVGGQTYVIRVDKNMTTYPDEAYNFLDGNIAGVLQKIGPKARWGNEFFNYGTGNGESGGYIASTIGTNMTSLITTLQNTACNTKTPLAEAYYVAMQYFRQQDVQPGLDYPNNVVPHSNIGDDPYYNGTQFAYCAKSFVILLTDGVSTYDLQIPDAFKDYDGDHQDPGFYLEYGSDYLDDIALYARTTDLRSNLDGDQNLILYTIYAFGNDAKAETLLKNAAKNGGFIDKDGDNRPSAQAEWDADNNGDPDTYFKADNGWQLEAKLLQAVNDILQRAASGTAVSVLATTGEGEANLVQAYYRPSVLINFNEVKWLGFLQSLWVDPYGNIREDTDQDLALDVEKDKVITYFIDPGSNDTKIKRFAVSATTPYPDTGSDPYEILDLTEVEPLWEAGNLLALRAHDGRKIFTYIDRDQDAQVDEASYDPLDANGEVVALRQDAANALKPYFGVKDGGVWGFLGSTHDERVANLIGYIRGEENAGLNLRSRNINGYTWKLGDIVNSTPVLVSKPPDNFHIIYGDESYQAYYQAFKDRETAVYVGANDGMLHAFTSWQYDALNKRYVRPSSAPAYEYIGDEMWAYIPQSLLPHLKWLPSPNYTHVFYVDLKPKLFDAKILPDDTHYTDADSEDNWGTILLMGLNMGGKHIQVTDDFNGNPSDADELRHFYPSYSCIDVTDPRNPRLLWERTYPDLEMTTSIPSVVRVKNKWFAVFGSGPSDYDGLSSKKGHVFVVDLKTGSPYGSGTNQWLFETAESYAFMNSPVSIDKDLNFNVDALYFGESYLQGGAWKGKLYKLSIPWIDSSGDYDGTDLNGYIDNPLHVTHPWRFSSLFNATRPISASLTLSRDASGNLWIYGGSGRYFNDADKVDTDGQYIFGIKDPFYNKEHTLGGLYNDNYYHNYSTSLELALADLLDATPYAVTTTGEVFENDTSIGNWNDLLSLARSENGWVRSLLISKERVLNKPSVLGGVVFAPSFVPNGDICGSGGESYLYGLYYETGTAYYKPAISQATAVVNLSGQAHVQSLESIFLGAGKASSLGIHVGLGKEAIGFLQQSTGNILKQDLNPVLTFKSSLKSWREK